MGAENTRSEIERDPGTTSSSNSVVAGFSNPDVALIGAGTMSATLAGMLKELDPALKIAIEEVLGSAAEEGRSAAGNG